MAADRLHPLQQGKGLRGEWHPVGALHLHPVAGDIPSLVLKIDLIPTGAGRFTWTHQRVKAPLNLATGGGIKTTVGNVGHQRRQFVRLEGGHVFLGRLLEHFANGSAGVSGQQTMVNRVVEDLIDTLTEAAHGLMLAVCLKGAQQCNYLRGADLVDRQGANERQHVQFKGTPCVVGVGFAHIVALQLQPLGGHPLKVFRLASCSAFAMAARSSWWVLGSMLSASRARACPRRSRAAERVTSG